MMVSSIPVTLLKQPRSVDRPLTNLPGRDFSFSPLHQGVLFSITCPETSPVIAQKHEEISLIVLVIIINMFKISLFLLCSLVPGFRRTVYLFSKPQTTSTFPLASRSARKTRLLTPYNILVFCFFEPLQSPLCSERDFYFKRN